MPLSAGARLGPYEILSPIGAGGLGEVYRARDTKLKRDIAIKVLPEALAHDAERKRRFVQEAQSASALNHPNIVTIYDIDLRTRRLSRNNRPVALGRTFGEGLSAKGGKIGGKLSLETMTPEQVSARARKAVAAREAKRRAQGVPYSYG